MTCKSINLMKGDILFISRNSETVKITREDVWTLYPVSDKAVKTP